MNLSDDVLLGLLEAAPDAIVAVDLDGIIVFANRQTEALFGWDADHLVGEAVEVLVPERFAPHHPGLRAGYHRAPATRPMGATTALAARRRDGSEFPVEISLSTIETADGMLVAAAIRDVTRSRVAEQKFRGLLASAPDAIVGVGPDGRIELLNHQASVLFGWPADELVGQPVEVLVPPEAVGRHVSHRRSYLDDPVTRPMGQDLQLRARRRDGGEFPAEISLSTIETEDGAFTTLAAVRDVSDRLELEATRRRDALRRQQERAHRLESIGQLAGGIAHDFNNLLGVILNYATLARRGVDDPAVTDDLDQITAAARRAADLTRQLLSFARRDVVNPEVVDLRTLVDEFGRLLRRTLGDHIELQVQLDEQPVTVVADRHQLEQVVLNLSLNARDAMPGGGVLRLGARVEGPDEDGVPGPHALLTVADEGSGMDAATLDRAFEPFFSTKPPGEGTGLGLASVYGIVQQNGGSVHLDSAVGVGTTVEVRLPVTEEVARQAEGADTARRPALAQILVVEDEEWLRRVVARMLRGAGYDVLVAEDGRRALKVLHEADRPVHLVLTDVVMPGVSGPELVRELEAGPDPVPPVLFTSGYAPEEFDLGGRPVLVKPFSEDELLAAVRTALDG